MLPCSLAESPEALPSSVSLLSYFYINSTGFGIMSSALPETRLALTRHQLSLSRLRHLPSIAQISPVNFMIIYRLNLWEYGIAQEDKGCQGTAKVRQRIGDVNKEFWGAGGNSWEIMGIGRERCSGGSEGSI